MAAPVYRVVFYAPCRDSAERDSRALIAQFRAQGHARVQVLWRSARNRRPVPDCDAVVIHRGCFPLDK